MAKEVAYGGLSTYEKWVEQEGLPVYKGYYIKDLKALPLKPWARKGGLGAIINLEGAEEADDGYVCEIPPGASLKPQRHLYEEMIFILSGRGATTIWQGGEKKQTFEWQEGSLFAPPLNTWHQHFNGSGDKPARYIGVTNRPLILNLFHNLDFIFKNDFIFLDRYSGDEGYFSGKGKSLPGRMWESNFIPDVYSFLLQEWKERGAGGKNILFELSENIMGAHISEFPVGTYKKAHRHGAGAHVIILKGTGYSLMWREGEERQRIDWQPGSMFVPPEMWFHQHFNTGKEPARYLALRAGGRKYRVGKQWGVDESVKAGGAQIEYEDEDPGIRELFEKELAKEGVTLKMSPVIRNKK